MRKLLLTFLLGAACAVVGSAQPSAPTERDKVNVFVGYSHNRVDTGADELGVNNTLDDREGFNGVNASITGNISRYVGLKFDYAFHQGEIDGTLAVVCVTAPCPTVAFRADARVHNFLGGVQIKDNTKDPDKRFRPFGHVLVGAHRSSLDVEPLACVPTPGFVCAFDGPNGEDDETGFAAAVGGGVDVRLSDRVSVRAIQLDWNPNRFSDNGLGTGSRTSHNFRVGVGIVFH